MQLMISNAYLFVTVLIILNNTILPIDAREKSSTSSTLLSTEKSSSHKHSDESWESDGEQHQYIDEAKTRRASYQHEQDLLAAIYSPERHYVSMHDDHIHPTNFTYFIFNSPGTYRFILISSRGDADLYISTHHKHVSYDNYEMSSCTCGIDEILVDATMKRPIYIGVYGYSQYQISKYRLLIEFVNKKSILPDTLADVSNFDRNSENTKEKEKSTVDTKWSDVHDETDADSKITLWDIFAWLINFLLEVLG